MHVEDREKDPDAGARAIAHFQLRRRRGLGHRDDDAVGGADDEARPRRDDPVGIAEEIDAPQGDDQPGPAERFDEDEQHRGGRDTQADEAPAIAVNGHDHVAKQVLHIPLLARAMGGSRLRQARPVSLRECRPGLKHY